MNLLFVTTHLPPDNHFGGVVQSSQALLTNLKKFLPNITACCVSADPERTTANNPHHPVCTKTLIMHRWGFSPAFGKNLAPLISNADIIVINGIMEYPMTVAGRICSKLNKPFVVSLRGVLLPHHMGTKPLRKKLFFHTFIRHVLYRASAIHVTCKQEYHSVANLGLKTPVTIVPNGANLPPDNIDSLELPPIIKSLYASQRLVLFMGRVNPVKGLDILVKSWATLVQEKKCDNVILVIAGPDERGYTEKLKSTVQELGIENKILFLGMIDGLSKWALYKYADIFILPSYAENFGLVVAEALACGTPVITTTGTPWKELEEIDAGRCVPPDKKALTGAICELLTASISQRQAMGQRGRAHVLKNYSWDVTARKFKTVCEHILDGKDIPMYPEPSGA